VITGFRASSPVTDPTCSFASAQELACRAAYVEPRWYAVYTRANHERRAHEQLLQRSIDSFLPTYLSVRRWKDRRVRLQMPLFPGYLFVHVPLRERLRVLEVPAVARLVGFTSVPVALEDVEVERLRMVLAQSTSAQPHPYLSVGRRVRVIAGPLHGTEGILVKRKRHFRVILSIDLIMRSVIVDVSEADLEPVFRSRGVSDTALATIRA